MYNRNTLASAFCNYFVKHALEYSATGTDGKCMFMQECMENL